MVSLRRSSSLLGLIFAVVACRDGTGPDAPRVTPREIQKIGGDEQAAVRGTPLDAPLRVRVIGSDGRPVGGARVQWTVGSGIATLEPSESTTDAAGEAESRMSVVGLVGAIEVRATVAGVAPALFAVEGLDPCFFEYAPTLTLGTSKSGALSMLDCFFDGYSSDVYLFSVPAQQAVSMRVRAPTFDPVVIFYPFAGWRLTLWDTVNATRDARIKAILPPGEYGLEASSFDADVRAPYEVGVTTVPESVEGCGFVLALPGIRTRQELTATDCGLESEPRADVFSFGLLEGDRIRITQTSTAFAPRLELRLFSGALVAQNDGSASGTAAIDFVATEPLAGYLLSVSSTDAAATGEYELVIAEGGVLGSTSAQRAAGARSARRAADARGVSLFMRAP
jgi:hypothetical protein